MTSRSLQDILMKFQRHGGIIFLWVFLVSEAIIISENITIVSHNGKAAPGCAMKNITVRSQIVCVMECTTMHNCLSANARETKIGFVICEMFNFTLPEHDGMLKDQEGSLYFQRINIVAHDCQDLYHQGQTLSTTQKLTALYGISFDVYCDIITDPGVWTVLQRRFDGSVDFYRDWNAYKNGFGDVTGEYWLGLDKIHLLTISGDYTLRFDMWDGTDHRYAEYKSFKVAHESDNYRLTFGAYSGTSGDSLSNHNYAAFSTYDRDNDNKTSLSCAVKRKGGFWYYSCTEVNPNGIYKIGQLSTRHHGITWASYKGSFYGLTKFEMKIKRSDSIC